jgi:hypothetical protein
MIKKENKEKFLIGKMVIDNVIGIYNRKNKGDKMDKENNVSNDENGIWK